MPKICTDTAHGHFPMVLGDCAQKVTRACPRAYPGNALLGLQSEDFQIFFDEVKRVKTAKLHWYHSAWLLWWLLIYLSINLWSFYGIFLRVFTWFLIFQKWTFWTVLVLVQNSTMKFPQSFKWIGIWNSKERYYLFHVLTPCSVKY